MPSFEGVPSFHLKGSFMTFKTFALSVVLMMALGFISGCTDRMPYNFNGKVSRYPHSKIVNIMRLKGGCYAQLETSDSGKKVLEYYRDDMTNRGWSVRIERGSEPSRIDDPKDAAFLTLFKGNEGLMIDTYTPVDGEKTQIALFLGDTNE